MIDASIPETGCCPKFDPTEWHEREIRWDRKKFVKDHVTSFLHIPLNMGSRMKRSMALIERAGASFDSAQDETAAPSHIVLSDHEGLWGSDLLIDVTRDVPGLEVRELTGTFLARVFEGPYQRVGQWMGEMADYVATKGKKVQHLYTYYTTCPRCAKTYGKNYVVLLAQVG